MPPGEPDSVPTLASIRGSAFHGCPRWTEAAVFHCGDTGGYLEHLFPSAHIYPGQLHPSSKLLSYAYAFLTCVEDQWQVARTDL